MKINTVIKILFNCLINGLFALTFFIATIDFNLPNPDFAESMKRDIYIKIYDRKNNLIAKYGHLQENIIKAEQLPKYLIFAIVDTEDKNFFKHKGIDVFATFRSFFLNLRSNKIVSGGSSISQQLAKNILQNEEKIIVNDKTILRKIKELILAVKIEKQYSKYEILTFYLNRTYFGSGTYGIHAASTTYFNKDPKDLTLYESAAIMGLLKAPSKFSGNKNFWKIRTKKVLKLMLQNNHITKKELEEFEKYEFPKKRNFAHYGYFTDYVITQIPQEFKNRDLIIKTTIDTELQNIANETFQKAFEEYGKAWNADQGAFVVLDKKSAIRVLIGGVNYHDSKFNRATTSQRSLGSFFKYYIYLEAMKQGLNPDSYINDEKITMGAYVPSNYLHKTTGKIKIKDAFALSVNSAAVLLLMACGIKNVIKLIHKLGIKSHIPENPSIALGGMNASILEMATTMQPIINSGYRTDPYCIEEIIDAKTNKLLYTHEPHFEKVLDNRTMWYMWHLLKSVTKYGSAKSVGRLENKIVGGKTGTSNKYKDLVFSCITPEYAIACWFGRDDFGPMNWVPLKHLGVIATKYFIEQLPENEEDLMFEIKESNNLSFEDLLTK